MGSVDSLVNEPLHVAPALKKKLDKLGLKRRFDLLLHLPLRYEDETHVCPIYNVRCGEVVLVEGEIMSHEVRLRPRRQLLVHLRDNSGTLVLRFLNFYPSQLKQLVQGQRIRALGEVRQGFGGKEIVHPKFRAIAANEPLATTLTPIYPTVSGLTQSVLRRLIHNELRTRRLDETLPDDVRVSLGLVPFADAIQLLHAPPPELSLQQVMNPLLPAWQRLKFDELLAQQLSMLMSYQARRRGSSPAICPESCLADQLLAVLPFPLTSAQQRVLQEIRQDLCGTSPMYRLLQGDVGSGKTIVAALSALRVISAGFQVALMAPTEVLAEQHYLKLAEWFAPLGVSVIWLSGALKNTHKKQSREAIAQAKGGLLVVGTHALFQEEVVFQRLGLIIIDEQHRFGVGQRLALKNKGDEPHQLMMSATPIPRTLAMSYYADLDVSVIDELPPGRSPIVTKLINNKRRYEVVELVAHICEQGQQAYWVCPLIEESEALQLQTAISTYTSLSEALPSCHVGLVHGRMKTEEKAAAMAKFYANEIQVLVATTVIEVGVDVPNATLMVIDHAERMGLAQLHQLRGRVGRGTMRSLCVLLYEEPLSALAKTRLKVIYEHTDGFEIARQDLLIRGPGEFLGAKQSGIPLLRFAKLEEDQALLESARCVASKLLANSPAIANAYLERWLPGREHFLCV